MSADSRLTSEVVTFEVGEIALVDFPGCARHGHEVEIVSALHWDVFMYRGRETFDWVHDVRVAGDNFNTVARPREMKKKKPPREDLQVVRWADVPWQPERSNA